jgi:adenosylhomocysteine nucleosidase
MEVDVGIVCALKLEAQALKAAYKLKPVLFNPWPFYKGSCQELSLGLILSGIGKVMAAAATQWLIDYQKPKIVLNWGCAGGINPQVEIGEIVAAQAAVEYDYQSRSPRRIAADKELFDVACSIDSINPGIFASADQNVDSLEKKQRLRHTYRASAGDWESAAVLRIAAANKIPALALRVISDLGDCSPGAEFNARTNALIVKAIPVLTTYIENCQPIIRREDVKKTG